MFSEELFLKAQDLIKNDFSPIDDMRASRNYRIEIAKNLLMKFFYEISKKKNIRINPMKIDNSLFNKSIVHDSGAKHVSGLARIY